MCFDNSANKRESILPYIHLLLNFNKVQLWESWAFPILSGPWECSAKTFVFSSKLNQPDIGRNLETPTLKWLHVIGKWTLDFVDQKILPGTGVVSRMTIMNVAQSQKLTERENNHLVLFGIAVTMLNSTYVYQSGWLYLNTLLLKILHIKPLNQRTCWQYQSQQCGQCLNPYCTFLCYSFIR